MDGVLVDSHPAHYRAWKRFLQLVGKPDHDLQIIYEGRKREEILRHIMGEHLDSDAVAHYGRIKDALFREESCVLTPITGIRELLISLRAEKIRCAVATSATRSRCTSMLAKLSLLEYFDVIITGSDVSVGKPDPAIYTNAVSALGIAPAHAIVFEDAVSGVTAARSAGLKCIGIESNGNAADLIAVGAELVIADASEIDVVALDLLVSDVTLGRCASSQVRSRAIRDVQPSHS